VILSRGLKKENMLIANINEEQSLLTRMDHLIAESGEMRVLVGFFCFRGIAALHGGLAKTRISS
jgi:hypothetical protein